MSTKVKVVSGLLVINDKFSVRTDGFKLVSGNDGVRVVSVCDGTDYFVKLGSEVGGSVPVGLSGLFLALAGLSSVGGGGSGSDVSWDDIPGKPVVVAEGATQAEARASIGAGTGNSNLAVSTTAPVALGAAAAVGTGTTAARADHVHPYPTAAQVGAAPASHTHTSAQISDSGVMGRQVLQAADAAAVRTLIGAGTSSLVIGTTAGTAGDGAVLAAKANTASPTFTGDPKAPTPALGDNDTSIATTAFVLANAGKNKTQIAALTAASTVEDIVAALQA